MRIKKLINIYFKITIIFFIVIFNLGILPNLSFVNNFLRQDNKVSANSIYTPTGGALLVGTNATVNVDNTGSWRATLGADNNYWTVTRIAAGVSLNMQLQFENVLTHNANKMILTIEDSNITTGTAYYHQICDWTSSTNVDNATDSECTGGGWRSLHPRKTTYASTSDTSRNYEIYDGYFWDRSATPGTVITTPLVNFIDTSNNNKVLIRAYSTVNATTQFRIDLAMLEMAIDPYYEPASFTKTAGGTTTNYVSDLIGAVSTNLTATDGNKMTVPMSAISTAADFYFSFNDVRNYTGANTILVMPEICVSNVALTFTPYLYNFNTTTWTAGTTAITGTACTTDTEYSFSFNSDTIGGFNINDHISNTNEVRFRILTNSPGTVYNVQLDRIYMALGSVNSDNTKCEISWGTGTAGNCSNTRAIAQGKTTTPLLSTWQATAALEYPSTFYPQDNDDDTTDAEYAASQNLSFPVTLNSTMSVTAVHYAAKYRSNSTAQTMDLQIRDYAGVSGVTGWVNTPGTDTNALTTYGWFDSWNLLEYQTNVKDNIDTVNGLMNLRARTSAGTTTNPGTRDWAFAFMSIRWVEESNRITVRNKFTPTGGNLVTGAEVAGSQTNMGSWRGLVGNDTNYWVTARQNPGGLNKQIYFDGVELYNANKIILTVEDSNITTGNAYTHQICDWISGTGVDVVADSECTGGGWRTLPERKVDFTLTTDTTKVYEIYNGYFSGGAAPGTVYDTDLGNFIRTSDNRVLIRVYSTVASTVQHRMDVAQIETAVDSIYEPSSFTKISPYAGATTNAISDIRGTAASDGTKLTFANVAGNALNMYYSFTNVQTYSGANTIVVMPEICVSNVALTFTVDIYNFNSSSFENISNGTVTGTACNTDTPYSYAKNNATISNYISSGEIRIRFTTATSNTNTLQFDRIYLMIGSTNTDSGLCEVSFGTGTAANCTNTRDVAGPQAGTGSLNTWDVTSVYEYTDTDAYPLDNDDDATGSEAAYSSNLSMPVTLTTGMSVSAIHFAARFRSNITSMTLTPALKDFSGKGATNGWLNSGATNALTTYLWTDSWISTELMTSPYGYIETDENIANMKLRTSASTNTTTPTTYNWDFAMISLRWVSVAASGTLSVDIVDGAGDPVGSPGISFTNVDAGFECQSSTATFGTSSQKIRVYNDTASPSWTLNMAASSGATAKWDAGGGKEYDYNDTGGTPNGCSDSGDADSIAGLMNIDFTNAVITPAGGCSATGLSLGSNSSFNQGTVDNIEILSASGSADTNCFWDITDIEITQEIPGSQGDGNYSINITLSIIAN